MYTYGVHVLCTCEYRCSGRPEGSVASPGTGGTGNCEPPGMGMEAKLRSFVRIVHVPDLLTSDLLL